MKNYWNATEGRLLMFALGFLLISGGVAAVLGFTVLGISLLCAGEIVAPTIALFAGGLGNRRYPRRTVLECIALPAGFFLFVIVQGLAMRYWPISGYAFIGVGLIPLVRSLLGRKSEVNTSDVHAPLHENT